MKPHKTSIMEPIKSLIPVAKWLLRFSAAFLIYTIYINRLLDFELTNVTWFIAALMVVFGVLLVAGGFSKKAALTVVSGMILCILSVIMIFMENVDLGAIARHLPVAAVGFYFLARGNKG